MSVTEGFFVLGSENSLVGDKPKVEKTAKGSFGSVARKRLGDISNLPQQTKPLSQVDKELLVSNTTKEYIEQLQKENVALMKLLVDRNKILELSGIELQKLRVNLQKLQQQNSQLAQANSQMLVELNSGKDRTSNSFQLKVLHHELGCKNGLLKARGLELEEKAKIRTSKKLDNQVRTCKSEEARESFEADRAENKPRNTNKIGKQQSKSLGPPSVKQVLLRDKTESNSVGLRRKSARFKSEEPEPTGDVSEIDDAKTENKSRVCLRRQSARFKSEEPESTEDVFEIDDAKFPACSLHDDQMQEDGSPSMCLLVKKIDKEVNSDSSDETLVLQRSSIGRPLRLAAKKVQSYKETPLNMKMRRLE
ncbi:SHUGOSHIN 2-like isoform X2 [Camellia sinensis]|uniref:SHUGOSHIN 2-like isoform X2 n=1 Tax=Camellia sinensis TaxID=4442 RepID=UPI0010364E6C|nr:SHUGOSHIN 2-like isoform X2 [Camellia sinensis]